MPPGPAPIPFYRPEAVVYAGLPGLARFIGLEILGTFHKRQGEQSLLTKNGGFPIAWGRAFGSRTEFRRGGPLAPEFDGHLFGFQAGMDLGAAEIWQGHRDHFGLFVGHAEADGDVRGFALGQRRLASGTVPMDATSLGLYWTHVDPGGWYLDSVLMQSWLDGEPRSNRGVGLDLEGHATTASVEGGYPIWLTDRISLEPQAQLIWQHVSFDPTQDRFSSVTFDAGDAWTGRIGARLQGTFQDGTTTWRPYLKVNLWHGFDATDRTQFSNVVLPASFGATSLEVGAGVVATLSEMSACSRSPTIPPMSMDRTAKPSRAISVFGSHGSKPSHDPWQGSKDRCIAVHDGVLSSMGMSHFGTFRKLGRRPE